MSLIPLQWRQNPKNILRAVVVGTRVGFFSWSVINQWLNYSLFPVMSSVNHFFYSPWNQKTNKQTIQKTTPGSRGRHVCLPMTVSLKPAPILSLFSPHCCCHLMCASWVSRKTQCKFGFLLYFHYSTKNFADVFYIIYMRGATLGLKRPPSKICLALLQPPPSQCIYLYIKQVWNIFFPSSQLTSLSFPIQFVFLCSCCTWCVFLSAERGRGSILVTCTWEVRLEIIFTRSMRPFGNLEHCSNFWCGYSESNKIGAGH